MAAKTARNPWYEPLPGSTISAAAVWQQPVRRARNQGRRLNISLLLSLLLHALLLSLISGGQEFGIPGFALPWQERRVKVPDLRVELAPARVADPKPVIQSAPMPLPPALAGQTVAGAPAVVTFRSAVRPQVQPATASLPRSTPKAKAGPKPTATPGKAPANASGSKSKSKAKAKAAPKPKAGTSIAKARTPPSTSKAAANPKPKSAPGAASASASRNRPEAEAVPAPIAATGTAPLSALADGEARPRSFPKVIALEEFSAAEFVVPPVLLKPAPDVSTVPEDAGGAEQPRIEQAVQEKAFEDAARMELAEQEQARQEAATAKSARLEAERQEHERQSKARQEAARQKSARQKSARQEAARQESARQEAARQESARQESARQESARQEAARQEAARQEAARQEAARQEAARAESARMEAERQQGARQAATQQDEARREGAQLEAVRDHDARWDAARRAMGRQLDREAARREANQAATKLSPSASTLRRARLFGRTDPNAELIRYAEAWSRRVQLNITFDMVREAAKQPHNDPVVTVAIRSDGSIESVTFVRSSGVSAIDDAIRRIIQSQTPNLPFQPALARDFDVIEIRRTWHFDTAVRLY